MAAIELPDGYFGDRPPVFGPLVQSFVDQFGDVHDDVARALDDWQNNTHPDTVSTLAGVDADDATINGAIATQHTSIISTPTGDAVAAIPQADTFTENTDLTKSSAGGYAPGAGIGFSTPPPEPPSSAAGSETQESPSTEDRFVAVTPRQPPVEAPTLPQAATTPAQPSTEPAAPSVAPEAVVSRDEAIVAATPPAQESGASPVPSTAAPYVTRDELLELLGQLEATVIVMT